MADKLQAAMHGSDVPLHSLEGHEGIAAELVACTLGARERLELRVDMPGQVAHLLAQGRIVLRDTGRRLAAELAAYRYPCAR